jgi:serine/threonine protein kinase
MSEGYIPTIHDEYVTKAMPLAKRLFKVGECLLERYEIFGVNPRGSFGVVYFVVDLRTDKKYAVKTYKPQFADLLPKVDGFVDEVSFWIKLPPHPNLVKAHFVEVIDDQPYLFLDYIAGFESDDPSLRNLLNQISARKGGLEFEQVIGFAYQLCLGMEAANKREEIAHLDLKPENILIDEEGNLKVTDFGLARQVKIVKGQYPKIYGGTWGYAAPEQFNGEGTTQSDIYSFGVILFEMTAGKHPYEYETGYPLHRDPKKAFEQLSNFHAKQGMYDLVRALEVTSIPGVEIRIQEIIRSCISHYHLNRYQGFWQLRKSLELAFQLKPSDIHPMVKINSEDMYQYVLSLHKIGEPREALSLCNRLLVENPNDVQVWLNAARTLLEIGNQEAAYDVLSHTLELDSNLEEARRLLDMISKAGSNERQETTS